MPTIQDLDRRLTADIAAARKPLLVALAEAARGRSWHYLLFGSLARGTARRGSDADIAVIGATGRDRALAERAARDACEALGLVPDLVLWDDLAPLVQAEAQREGIRCGA
ncbi:MULTISPECIES: nucleotidyltransferase family protein [Roseomonadaceae]|uniref:Nucleotidyltransferase domain-containing protein n=1 Tax=Falsiroseomonas oleicola TaxID=2801474 RepID=A0ABS6H313_9PROT|nr:nucleotidyltransferase domain-containing protein [Roseomonas oleicola]MBU8543062.1 nucleotidyltransferase domain-containing protein [Roseomonas oleicola]